MKGMCLFLGLFLFLATGVFWLTQRCNASEGDSSASIREAQFAPTMEADMPAGFPAYTPVGKVEVKNYPAYRKATALGSSAFWKLFSHIKTNDIAMTAPVEMTYAEPGSSNPREESMAFLYGDPHLGKTTSGGMVEVDDVPQMTVVSIGVRGARNDRTVAEAVAKLRTWLDTNEDSYSPSGPLRVMAYNSPFVPEERRFFEVQIPVSKQQSGTERQELP